MPIVTLRDGRYVQPCSGCVGRAATALHDVERYEREATAARMLAMVARRNSLRAPYKRNSEPGAADDYAAEAIHHASVARGAEYKRERAATRLLASTDGPCRLCGGVGSITSTGTFVRGAKGPAEVS